MPEFAFTTFNAASGNTLANGVNVSGQIVGSFGGSHGFLYSGGTFTTVDVPGASSTAAYGISASGQIVGSYTDGSGIHGFFDIAGTYLTLNDPLATGGTSAFGINSLGQIVGAYSSGSGVHGFLYSGGVYTTLDDPSANSSGTQASGINDFGQIVGTYGNSTGTHGFLYSQGTYTTEDVPAGTSGTWVQGINNGGQFVGYYSDSIGFHGFIKNGTSFTSLDDPLATSTAANGIASGVIVGTYFDSNGAHGWQSNAPNVPTVSSISAVADTHTTNVNTGHLVMITMITSEVVTVTGIPTLQLNDNEVAAYTSGSGTNTLTFTYAVQSGDNTADLQVAGLNLPAGAAIADQAGNGLTGSVSANLGIQVNNVIDESITKLYVGYYDRAPDPSGETYWAGQLQGGLSLSQIAQSYSVQTESTNLYSFLANPNTTSPAAVKAFVDAIYVNLFNRTPDTGGEAYWMGQMQTGASTVGGAIINIISGAQANDLLTVNNKVTVGDYYDMQIFSHNVQFSGTVAQTALSAVTFNASSIATAEAIVDAYVQTAPHATQAATASQTEVNLVGTSASHDLVIAT